MAKILIERALTSEEERALTLNNTTPTKIATWFLNALNARIDSEVGEAKRRLVIDKTIKRVESI